MFKLKQFLRWLLFVIVAVVFWVAGSLIGEPRVEVYTPGVEPERIILTWSDTVYNSQSVTWRTDTTVHSGYVQWTKAVEAAEEITDTLMTNSDISSFHSDVNIAHYHKAKMTGLTPGQQYLYRVGDGNTWSEWFQFRTARKSASDFSFLYFGDLQNEIKTHCSRIIRKAYSSCPNAAFMLFAGDLVDNPEDNLWGEWFDCGDWIFSSVSVMAAPGNHEYIRDIKGGLGKHWKYQFSFPKNGPKDLTESVFYFDYQGVRFIVLDTEGMSDGLLGSYHKQKEWLANVLEENPNRWSVVIMHHPVFSNKYGRDNSKLRKLYKPVFEKYDVDLVLQGHDHTYGRTGFMSEQGNKGPVYVISVTGPKMYDSSLKTEMKRLATSTQLFQKIDVTGNSIVYTSYTATGILYDQFTLHKNQQGNKELIEMIPADQPERLKLSQIFRKRYSQKEIDAYQAKAEQRRLKCNVTTASN